MDMDDVPNAARFDDEEIVDWLNDRDWTLIPEHKYESVNRHMYISQVTFDGEDADLFERAMESIQASPFSDEYSGTTFKYRYDDAYKYWISPSHYTPGMMLNRKEVNPDHIQVTLDDL